MPHPCCLQEGVGRRVGEQSEQVWSRVKPFSLVARYMAPPRWWDGYNSLFALLGQLVQRDLPQLLEKKLKNIGNTISACIALHCLPLLHFVPLWWHQKAPPVMAFTHSPVLPAPCLRPACRSAREGY